MLRKLFSEKCGATAIEYALIASLISLACTIAFVNLGLSLNDAFGTLINAMS